MTDDGPRLGIVTGEHAPDLSDDAQHLVAELRARGVAAEPVRWDDPTVAWDAYDGALFRSCWEYPTDGERFERLLDELDRAGCRVCNPLPAIRWNAHKSYLVDLAAAGVRLPPTTVVAGGADDSLAAVLDRHGWDEAVVKPGVGSFSRDVRRVSRDDVDAAADHFRDLLASGDVVVQRFVPEITAGERSIVLFDGAVSHAWNSLPTDDDVTEFDGIDADYDPPAAIREAAPDVLRAARGCIAGRPESIPYARVDYVHRDGRLLLMELELIEPYLGLTRGEGAPARFADALVDYYDWSPQSDHQS